MIIQTTAYKTDFVGLFLVFAGPLLYPVSLPEKEVPDIPKKPVNAESNMLGIFYAGNKKGIVGPQEADIKVNILRTKYTALGNLIKANDKGAIISPLIEPLKTDIEKILGVEASVATVAGLNLVGSLVLANNKGAVVHPAATEDEIDLIENALKVHTDRGTLVKSGFLGSMAVASDEALVVSPSAIAPELAQVSDVLEIE